MLEFQRSADVLLTLIIGGAGWLYGGIAGAIAFKILQDVLSSSAPQFWMFWMGMFLVALALVGRERLTRGVRGLVARVVRSMTRRSRPAASPSASAAWSRPTTSPSGSNAARAMR